VDSETFNFLPREAKPGERILLVDSIVQTGQHLEQVTEKIRQNGAEVVGTIVFCHNDMLLGDALKDKRPIVDSCIKQGKLVYLYKMSELYERRRGRGE